MPFRFRPKLSSRGWPFSHVHVRTADFVFRSRSAESPPRSVPVPLSLLVRLSRVHGTVRFFFWWLFLHRRLRSRQRGSSSFDVSDLAPCRLIISLGRYPFLSGQLRSACQPTFASLSASTPGVLDSGFPLLLSSNGVSPPPFHLPVPVKIPVSNSDCEISLHPEKLMSSRKYFNYDPYFTGALWKSCG